ncbi:hypothetical protein [Neobacillus niacini]|jgi:hypothetical protein|uniref:hypothetical protein n=1 Tax=Neobacillus niacini TaxID=86668 RepID=UPI001C8D0B99|nr:hypothetical protein [Neobacillus niacini]MBY0147731.1 hypothetical protein [Neobacillus niacini]
MSLYEIGRDIERLNHRITELEGKDSNDCGCNGEQEEVYYPFENNDGIVIKFTPLTPSQTLITVTTKSGTEVGNGFIPIEANSSLVEKDGFKVLTIIHPTDAPFTPSDHYTFAYRGLGFGRGWCKNRNGLKCGGKINLDKDCVGQDSYMNWASGKCPFLHMCGGEWYWYLDPKRVC